MIIYFSWATDKCDMWIVRDRSYLYENRKDDDDMFAIDLLGWIWRRRSAVYNGSSVRLAGWSTWVST